MKHKRTASANAMTKISLMIALAMVIAGVLLSLLMYLMIRKSFFQAMVSHESEQMIIMETIGGQLIDGRLRELKMGAENTAREYGEELAGGEKDKEEVLSSISLGKDRLNYCYQTRDRLFCGEQFHGEYAARLDLSGAWEGDTLLFSPDFDADGNYILAVAVPVWKDREVNGILIEQMDGYCISRWIGDLFLPLDLGTAYIVDDSGRNIAAANEDNYDWITTRYNSQELVKENDDESTRTVARLEKFALDGKTGIDSYLWEGSRNYVAYGPLKETGWGFFVGFYGDKMGKYSQEITIISSRAAGAMLVVFILFSSIIIAIVMRNLSKERGLNEMLVQQKEEMEQQALRIAASEERFRIAMQRSRDIVLEYQLETGDITCFYADREINSGRVGDDALRKKVVEECCMDEDSFERFEGAMLAISRGLTSAECMVSGDRGDGRKWYNMSLSVIPNSLKAPTRAVGILRDVTGEREAEMDSLTRLLNKAAMTDFVRKAMQKNLLGTAGAFVMLDVDNFKQVNDKYGHPVGDQVLCAIADNLREVFPPPCMTGRFGGDEFSIYCPSHADIQELQHRLKRLGNQVRRLQGDNGASLGVTLSIGVAIFYGCARFEEIYKKADEMLYEVKKSGRDGCKFFEL